ncbi:hypothetical protein HK096_006131 [Nowakowskiella sp. JEL0078]|nr:hypothetical protein HK096_006131 [Nowakowskiella sp. JEL0078]
MNLPGSSKNPCIAFDYDGYIFAVGLDSKDLRLYDMNTYDKGPFFTFNYLDKMRYGPDWTSIKFSYNGKLILICTRGEVLYIVDAFDGQLKFKLTGHENKQEHELQACFSPDSQWVLCGSQEGLIHVWSTETGKMICTFEGHHDPSTIVEFNPKYLIEIRSKSNIPPELIALQSPIEIDDIEDEDLELEKAGKVLCEKIHSHDFLNDANEEDIFDSEGAEVIDRKLIKSNFMDAEKRLDSDIQEVEEAAELFVNSKIINAENIMKVKNLQSLYHTHTFGIITAIKAMLTFEPQDVDAALYALKNSIEMASIIRKEQKSFVSSLFSGIFGVNASTQYRIQKHAELIFAEANLIKAMLSLVIDTNIVAFVQQGLSIRNSYNIIKNLFKLIEKTHQNLGIDGFEKEGLDPTLVQGILFNMGCFGLTLSLLPTKVLRLFELVGFSGDRNFALMCLETAGGWKIQNRESYGLSDNHNKKRNTRIPNENHSIFEDILKQGKGSSNLRKFLCDLFLLGYHVYLSPMFQLPDINLGFANEILEYQLRKHPDSFIFLGVAARLKMTLMSPVEALKDYKRVITLCDELQNLSHTTYWDMGICHAAQLNWNEVYNCYEFLSETRWGKAFCRYLMAVSLDMKGDSPSKVVSLLEEVPTLTKKLAGKSIPIEKFVVRKCRKFKLQGGRLLYPFFEIMYFLHIFEFIPAEKLLEVVGMFNIAIDSLDRSFEQANKDNSDTEKELLPYDTFYDDLCLARFLKGVALSNLALPVKSFSLLPIESQAKLSKLLRTDSLDKDGSFNLNKEIPTIKKDLKYAASQLEFVISQAHQIKLDHWILPFARFEHGQILIRLGNLEKARAEFDTAIAGGYSSEESSAVKWVLGKNGRKKASMENRLQISVHNASSKIEMLQRLEVDD